MEFYEENRTSSAYTAFSVTNYTYTLLRYKASVDDNRTWWHHWLCDITSRRPLLQFSCSTFHV